jgi:hypothetical protein
VPACGKNMANRPWVVNTFKPEEGKRKEERG